MPRRIRYAARVAEAPVAKTTRSCLQIVSMADRPVISPDGSPPPGMTHWPTIINLRNPGSVFGSHLKPLFGVNSHPSMLPFQLPV